MNKTLAVGIVALVCGVFIGYGVLDRDGMRGYFYKDGDSREYQMRGDFDDMMLDGGGYGMLGVGGHMMQMSVASEKEFIEGMIPHHQEAVDTAKEVIERGGTTPEVKTLVENIVIAQEAEIANMKSWYKSWYGEDYIDNNSYQPMMRELESLSGSDIDRAFLQDMIMHHMGAIMMARSVTPYIEHQEIKELTSAIVITQSQEMVEMRTMLQSL